MNSIMFPTNVSVVSGSQLQILDVYLGTFEVYEIINLHDNELWYGLFI